MDLDIFFPVDVPPAVHEQGGHFLVGKAHGMQHGGPVHAVGGHQDILADDFAVRGPEFGESSGRPLSGSAR